MSPEEGVDVKVIGQTVESRGVQARPQAERLGPDHKRPPPGTRGGTAQPSTEGRIERLLEARPGVVHGFAQQALDILVEGHRRSHARIMMLMIAAVKM